MPSKISIRKIGIDDWPLWRKLRLEALQEAPYAFSSRFCDWQGDGDTEARWRGRLSSVPLNIVAVWKETAVGMVSATAPDRDGTAELISMWVAPFARGRGIGDSLVNAVIEWAREQTILRLALAVFERNEYALALYRRHAFVDVGPIADGSPDIAERQMVLDLTQKNSN